MARTDYGAILSTVIKDTSDAVREVNGTSSLIAPNQWGTAIRTMHSDSDYENALEQMIEETATGDIASFSDGANDIPLKNLTCTINPVQSGSGDPSPSNIRPITGHTELNLVHTGKNLFDISTMNRGSVTVSDGVASGTAGQFNSTFNSANPLFKAVSDDVITISLDAKTDGNVSTSGNGLIIAFRYTDDSTQLIAIANSTTSYTRITATSNSSKTVKDIEISYASTGGNNWYVKNVQIELDSSATAYEPYTGTTTTTDFGTTVYGGTLDVVSGVLTIDRGYFTSDDTDNWVNVGGSYPFAFQLDTGVTNKVDNPIASQGIVCNLFPQGTSDVPSANAICWQVGGSTGRLYVYDYDHSGDLTAFKNMLHTTPLQVCYKLTTPITTQLTPQEVKSLLGSNNIYHDCNGQVAVTYRANGQLYVEQHT